MDKPNPHIPRETCRTIDKTISLIEEIREANSDLRKAVNDLEEYASWAEDEIHSLREQLKQAKEDHTELERQFNERT